MVELINHASNSIFRKYSLQRVFPNPVTYIICDLLWKNWPLAFWVWINADFTVVKEPGSKKFPKPSYGQNLYTGHPYLSSQFFEKQSVLYVHSSTFNVSILHHAVCTIMWICRERWPQREHQYSSPGLREKISREAMVSTLRKLSMIVLIAKAACNKHLLGVIQQEVLLAKYEGVWHVR